MYVFQVSFFSPLWCRGHIFPSKFCKSMFSDRGGQISLETACVWSCTLWKWFWCYQNERVLVQSILYSNCGCMWVGQCSNDVQGHHACGRILEMVGGNCLPMLNFRWEADPRPNFVMIGGVKIGLSRKLFRLCIVLLVRRMLLWWYIWRYPVIISNGI